MVTRARGRFINRPTKTGRGVYDKFFVYIPTELARDSSFPLKPGQEVDVQIDSSGGMIMVQPLEAKTKRRQPSRKEK
jgi:bifunctional DNA-binding transcriptional regulator/antitoxin component of YhaV-PrlF toxin-antitoxin module